MQLKIPPGGGFRRGCNFSYIFFGGGGGGCSGQPEKPSTICISRERKRERETHRDREGARVRAQVKPNMY